MSVGLQERAKHSPPKDLCLLRNLCEGSSERTLFERQIDQVPQKIDDIPYLSIPKHRRDFGSDVGFCALAIQPAAIAKAQTASKQAPDQPKRGRLALPACSKASQVEIGCQAFVEEARFSETRGCDHPKDASALALDNLVCLLPNSRHLRIASDEGSAEALRFDRGRHRTRSIVRFLAETTVVCRETRMRFDRPEIPHDDDTEAEGRPADSIEQLKPLWDEGSAAGPPAPRFARRVILFVAVLAATIVCAAAWKLNQTQTAPKPAQIASQWLDHGVLRA